MEMISYDRIQRHEPFDDDDATTLNSNNIENPSTCNDHGSKRCGQVTTATSESFHLRKRFSTSLIIAAFTSLVLLLSIVSVLTFLWHGNDTNQAWLDLVLANWVTRSVTLSALGLRIAISLQAAIATSMLASLVLEDTGLQFCSILEVSVMRFSNAGPLKLLWIYAKQANSPATTLLVTVLVLSTIATQLSSTLLLSDIGTITIFDSPSNSNLAYGFSTNLGGSPTLLFEPLLLSSSWKEPMTQYPAFGEYSLLAHTNNSIDDTGLMIRAMVPIAAQNTREALRSYEGPGFAYDARTVCVQPAISSIERCGDSLCGKVSPRSMVDNAVLNMNDTKFECAMPVPGKPPACSTANASYGSCPETTWTLCRLQSEHAGGLISVLDATNNASLQHQWFPFENSEEPAYDSGIWAATDGNTRWPVVLGNAYLIYNATSDVFFGTNSSNSSAVTYVGPWTDIRKSSNSSNGVLRATLCYDALYVSPYLESTPG